MGRFRSKTAGEKIFDSILFLAEVFGEYPNKDIPDVPVRSGLNVLSSQIHGFGGVPGVTSHGRCGNRCR